MFTLNDIFEGNGDSMHLSTTAQVDPEQTFAEAHHDSRLLKPGDLFIARQGETIDGHHFIARAAQAGAGAALCKEAASDAPADFLQIVVPDVLKALHATARTRAQRQKDTIFIGITGSNGKTSTKDAIAAVLSHQAPTLKTFASYNHELGFPQTLLRLEPQHRYAVLEMGAQWVGELTWLCETIARPNWSVITNVGAAHLGYFGSQERVAQAKSELVQALQPEGVAILNYDDPNVRAMREKTVARVLFYGLSPQAHVYADEVTGDPLRGLNFTLNYDHTQRRVELHLPGNHSLMTVLAAAAAGVTAEMHLDDICAALEELRPPPGRCEIKPGPNGSTLLDDTYNANRQSILAALQAIQGSSLGKQGKRWIVLGDIFELGEYAQPEHFASGAACAEVADYLVAFGDQARFYIEGALKAGMRPEQTYYFSANVENPVELEAAKYAVADLLSREVRSEDLVLLKGSRGMRTETIMTTW
ncbi:MAG TPA: UDP-N-acetylmuramoyl-tripeptide--D-alanyl-D-alanine ligase [Ktedonobacteraceae bacterium]|nr:UDP-N-acetylmuramoyl-tripeptide--D-alanyl-D-alanine ligase [Ktedonobacteraceae bacterium]